VTIPPPIPEPEIPQPHEPGIESPREEPRPSFRGPRSLRTNPHRPKRSRRQATIRSAPESRSRRETHATPIDDIEIDGSCVAGMGRAREQPGIVRSMLSLGRTLHLQTIAEGIEEPGQAFGTTLAGPPTHSKPCNSWLAPSADGRAAAVLGRESVRAVRPRSPVSVLRWLVQGPNSPQSPRRRSSILSSRGDAPSAARSPRPHEP
jgi:hypothetical protein